MYPETYCNLVNDLEYACMDLSILELWANDGIYDSKSDQDIASLTLEDVLDKVPYMYYVTTFLGFFEPPPTVSLKTKTLFVY